VEETAAVAAPVEAVWAALVDVERWPTWTRSMRRVRRLDEGPLAVGSRVRIKQPRLVPVVWTVTELDPGRSFTWEAESAGVRSRASHEVRAMGAGTSELRLTFDQTGPLSPVIGAVLGRLTRRYVRMEAEGLAQHLR
jgi:uncharacterized protein YndB with AHSA1/START domain